MGDNNFNIKNDRLRRFYENADRFADEDFARQERKGDDLIESTRLSMDFPKQAVEALSKIADDEGFPLQEMSDKEILSIGVFLHNVGELFFHVGEPRQKLSEEIADMDESALKSFYKGILSTEKDLGIDYDYDVIKDKEKRKHIAEFIYQIVEEDNYFIIEKVSPGAYSLRRDEPTPPGVFKLVKPCSEYAVRGTLLDYIYEKSEKPTDRTEQIIYKLNNFDTFSPLKRKGAGLPKRGAFEHLYNNL